MKIQIVNWIPEYKGFAWWAFPRDYKKVKVYKGKPFFWGLVLGFIEIRFWTSEVEK